MNGALTIGTLDGANVEILERVGAENFFAFGLTTEQVAARKTMGYRPATELEQNEELRRSLDAIARGTFSQGNGEVFRPLVDNLAQYDPYLVLADYAAYADCQRKVGSAYANLDDWTRKSILNVARMGWFSSDRSIREYSSQIWNVSPIEPESNGPKAEGRTRSPTIELE